MAPTDSEASDVERVVRLDDASFRVLSSKQPSTSEATVFVLVHGIGTSHRYLSKLHEELARDAQVHSLDLPGFGGLPKPGASLSVRGMAAALGSVLDHLGVASAVLVGHSMGAQWVVELAASRPDLASEVVLIGPVADDEHRTAWSQAAGLARDTIGETLSANGVVLLDYVRCGPVWFLKQLREMIAYPIEGRIRSIVAPLLVIRGGNDPIAGTAWCRKLRWRARNGSFVVVPGNRHVVQFTAASTVASAIRAFLTRARPTAPDSSAAEWASVEPSPVDTSAPSSA